MARSFADEMTIDPETGLPALPEGFAWRVRAVGSNTLTVKTLTVELVVKVETTRSFWEKFFNPEPTVEWEEATWSATGGADYYTYIHEEEPTKEDVLAAATKVYDGIYDRLIVNKSRDELIGLYPPKTIL